jgi:phage/plasmid-like protein (TIGR03299 family)
MAHNLFKDQMAWVASTPWHGLGTRVPACVRAEEMIQAAGLNWGVSKEPAPGARFDQNRGVYDRYVLTRDPVRDESTPATLGLVKAGYEVVQNTEAFRFFQPFTDKGYARFETAGALGNGERIWVLARLIEDLSLTETDIIKRFLLLSNSHDGHGAVSIRFTPIRVVCQNTLNWALKGGSAVIAVRHTKNVSSNLIRDQAEKLRVLTDKVYADMRNLCQRMLRTKVNEAEKLRYLSVLFPRTHGQQSNGERPQRWQRIDQILGSEEARLERIWFGRGQELKLKALAEARNLLAA